MIESKSVTKRSGLLAGMVAVLLAIGLVLAACPTETEDPGNGGDPPTDIIYEVTANGSTSETTTALIFTFSSAVTGLTEEGITISGSSVTKGALSGSGKSWTLALTVTTPENITVSIAKDGIERGEKPVTVYVQGQEAPLTGYTAAANGNANTTTTALTLTFTTAVSGLTKDGITISGSGVTTGALSGSGKNWTLALTVTTADHHGVDCQRRDRARGKDRNGVQGPGRTGWRR